MIAIWISAYMLLNAGLVVKDVRDGLLPDNLTCPLLWIGLSYQLIFAPQHLANAVTGALAGYLSLCFFYWAYRWLRGYEGLGYGDVKFLGALGAWHGWQLLGVLLTIASLLGLAAALIVYYIKGKAPVRKTPLPFGPFLAIAGLVCSGVTFQILTL
ncbi:prepilin peptidase [Cronobacter sakazakii]|uniref:prepilin peptidase n=1 Tax=Cronobacter sakazakii TaxID=28141 RepID=UPI000CF1BF7F|nr:A24 family peptidase [Cronobacter sakazakii]EJK9927750.1 prepilin peptidase [Cronobacter sakazakii]ELQ5983704.1 prepilin peptidase [Cronobacter sakazakii]ELY2592233.1 prepilin peptidase [Cronobacter sakazakii]ELY2676611.1 prepilin peptidase [Cronobacter sakazakii]ELY2751724.1 prepilin peptidase [Cronobacter sakazakii]